MPVLFDEKRMRDSSAENDAPAIDVVFRNWSMVYWRDGRTVCAEAATAHNRTAAAQRDWRSNVMNRLLLPAHSGTSRARCGLAFSRFRAILGT